MRSTLHLFSLLACLLYPRVAVTQNTESFGFEARSAELTVKPETLWAAQALSPRGLENLSAATRLLSYVRFFHPSDQAVGVTDWDRLAIELLERAEPATDEPDLAKRLTDALAPIAPTLQIWAGAPQQAPPVASPPAEATVFASWRHFGAGRIGSRLPGNVYSSRIERSAIASGQSKPFGMYAIKTLGGGVSCRLPVMVYADSEGTLPHGKTPDEWGNDHGKPKLTAFNRSTRLAGVALGWGVFQHFYPYFDVVDTDWDSALAPALKKAAEDPDEISYLQTLWEMTAQLNDGHANVSNSALGATTFLPLSLQWAGAELVVVGTHKSAGDSVKRGDVVVSIDGKSADECYRLASKWISAATDGWQRRQSINRIMIDLPTADPVSVTLRRSDSMTYSIALARVKEWPANTTTRRPDNGVELAPGIVYFNLDRATIAELNRVMAKLERARGIVFDLRGYPGQAGTELMRHLIDVPATSAVWIVPVVTLPDQERVKWSELERWALAPKSPRLLGKIVFLSGGGAISYAESIMGIVESYKFGEIVGSTTAGTNGNVNLFTLPGGFLVSFTGMIVLKHDGSRHHGVGIAPTVPVVPTAAGIAAGKDEVLEKAVEVLRAKLVTIDRSP